SSDQPCPDCGAKLEPLDGVTHAYLGGSPACWAAFNDVLAREFQDVSYFSAHRFTVDAYTTQHPGDQSDRRAAQSVNIHLAALCALIDQGLDKSFAPHLLKTLANNYKDMFQPLSPPAPDDYTITIKHVLAATSAKAHTEIVLEWSHDVWRAWAAHHDTARRYVKLIADR
ncbi:MAG: DUF5946 family protein, partial [Pseudomonadota bacterium]